MPRKSYHEQLANFTGSKSVLDYLAHPRSKEGPKSNNVSRKSPRRPFTRLQVNEDEMRSVSQLGRTSGMDHALVTSVPTSARLQD